MFSIITVCFDCDEKVFATGESLRCQSSVDWEWVVKDGGDTARLREALDSRGFRVQYRHSRDSGIYDAMNQALAMAKGRYVIFMNAGDRFASPETLGQIVAGLERTGWPVLAYGDQFDRRLQTTVPYPSLLSRWFLFRNNICHQCQVIARAALVHAGGFDTTLRLRADQEAFLRLAQNYAPVHLGVTIADYEGAGVSEAPSQRQLLADELGTARRRYFSRGERVGYGVLHELTLFRARRSFLRSGLGVRFGRFYYGTLRQLRRTKIER